MYPNEKVRNKTSDAISSSLSRINVVKISDKNFSIDLSKAILRIILSQNAREQLVKPRQKAVVVRLMGKTIGYRGLCSKIQILLKQEGDYKVIDLCNEYFLVNFADKMDHYKSLLKGPWLARGHCLTVQPWSFQFDTSNENLSSVLVWVRFPNMPLHLYHKKVLRTIAGLIDMLVKINYNTMDVVRGKFARIAISVDLTKPLLAKFSVEDRVQIVEYEGLQNECFTCGGYDHSKEFCHVHALVVSREGASKNDSGAGGAKIQENTSTEEENFRK
ncbi:hypothetical protein P3X46_028018 [Hevea brasiliensis]|uniref:DUF4283 domain-containing protein n=1 Tax=Hevea brasiliensis TaxID=3981 RepID=A0ABQ9KMN3_HEVBR|nr:uncharacterized protein LOC131174450 [Hevea brasiliensis]KAJ9145661.1 hypothetical protein P3X46_028018 [Hevea brasiliensis]